MTEQPLTTTADNEEDAPLYETYEDYLAENPDAKPVGDDGEEVEEDPADGGDVAAAVPQEDTDGTTEDGQQ